MLHVYRTTDSIANERYLFEVDTFFEELVEAGMHDFLHEKLYRNIIYQVDGARLNPDSSVSGKFGLTNLFNISSGCKAILLAVYYSNDSDTWVNFNSAGENVLRLMYNLAKHIEIRIKYDGVVTASNDSLVEFRGVTMTASKCLAESRKGIL